MNNSDYLRLISCWKYAPRSDSFHIGQGLYFNSDLAAPIIVTETPDNSRKEKKDNVSSEFEISQSGHGVCFSGRVQNAGTASPICPNPLSKYWYVKGCVKIWCEKKPSEASDKEASDKDAQPSHRISETQPDDCFAPPDAGPSIDRVGTGLAQAAGAVRLGGLSDL